MTETLQCRREIKLQDAGGEYIGDPKIRIQEEDILSFGDRRNLVVRVDSEEKKETGVVKKFLNRIRGRRIRPEISRDIVFTVDRCANPEILGLVTYSCVYYPGIRVIVERFGVGERLIKIGTPEFEDYQRRLNEVGL